MAKKEQAELSVRDAEAPRLFAVIDVGATAVRMEIAELLESGAIHTIEQVQQAVHLGKDTFTLGRIQQGTIEECVNILKNCRRVMEEYGITDGPVYRDQADTNVALITLNVEDYDRAFMWFQDERFCQIRLAKSAARRVLALSFDPDEPAHKRLA